MHTRLLLPLAVVALVVLSGCGGGDGKIGSKAAYVAAGDKVCADRDKRSVKLAQTSNGNVADVTRGLAAIYSDTIAKLKAIPLPPGSARAGAQEFVTAVSSMSKPVERMNASADDVEAAVKSKKTLTIKDSVTQLQSNVNTVQAIGDSTDQKARNYGFKVCGQQQQANPVG